MPTLSIPRKDRDMMRGRLAANAVIAAGGSAMDAAKAQIDAAFSQASVHNSLKLRVASVIKRGPSDAQVQARYGTRARALYDHRLFDVVAATKRIALWRSDAKLTFDLAQRVGTLQPRLSLMVLTELHLLVRWMRRYRAKQFPIALEAILD